MDKATPNGTKAIPKNIKCSNCSDNAQAVSYCIDCIELVCRNCVDAHQRLKAIRNHTIKSIDEAALLDVKCKNCDDDALAVSWCTECSEFICSNCVSAHKRIKMTKSHTIVPKNNLFTVDEDISKNLNTGCFIQLNQNANELPSVQTGRDSECSKSTDSNCLEPNQEMQSSQISYELISHQTSRDMECSQQSDNNNLENDQIQSDQISLEFISHQTGRDTECSQQSDSNNLENDQVQTSDHRTDPPTEATNNQSKNISISSSLSTWFNLTTVLNDSSDGKAILHYYEEEGIILPKHRKILNKLILEKTFSVKNELTVSEREEIAQQISLVFHQEQSNKYFDKKKGQRGQILTGSLQAAYNYRKNKTGNVKKRKRNNAENMEDVDDESQNPSNYFNGEVEKSFQNMQQNSVNDDMALIEWEKCFEFRKVKMSHYKTVDEVCEDWPFFCRLDGFSFIKYDFEKMFGSGNALLFKWLDFIELNLKVISAMINDPRVTNSLNELNVEMGFDEKSIIFCMALFHIPEIIQAAIGYGPKRWRPTVKNSKNSVFKRVFSRDSITRAVRARNIERVKNQITEHPLIYGVGEHLDEMTDFYVALGDILYKFNSFIEALDASFKCFKVLQLDYPKESINFWTFVDLVFYKTDNQQNSPSIVALVNSLILNLD